MIDILKIMEKIASKISLSVALPQNDKDKYSQPQSINLYVNSYPERKIKKVSKIYFVSKLEDFFEDELIKEIIIKVEYDDGSAAEAVPIEFGIDNIFKPIVKKSDKFGLVHIENIRIKDIGTYKIYAKDKNGIIITDVIKIKPNKKKVKFLIQPQDVSSKEVLDEILVQVIHQSGTKAANKQVRIEINKENVSFEGTKIKLTNQDGLASFNNLVFTKTGGYKLKAVCEREYAYSETFHVFPPGVKIDFEKCEAGSSEEIEAFLTALIEKQSQGDIIKYNGEEY